MSHLVLKPEFGNALGRQTLFALVHQDVINHDTEPDSHTSLLHRFRGNFFVSLERKP